MAGWFSIDRKLFDHWLWTSKEPFDCRSAWIDLIGLATYKDHHEFYNNAFVLRKRGEINVSMLWLAKRWKWDRRKVKRFLMALADDGMLSLNSTTNGTTITLENYDFYQSKRTTDGTYECTTDVQPDVHTITKDNNHIINNIGENPKKTGWQGRWTYQDPVTGRIRFNVEQARKERNIEI